VLQSSAEPLKVRLTLTEPRTALFIFVKVCEPELLIEPRSKQPWC